MELLKVFIYSLFSSVLAVFLFTGYEAPFVWSFIITFLVFSLIFSYLYDDYNDEEELEYIPYKNE